MDDLKQFVIERANDLNTQKITKKEMEGFLASYDYNKDSQTGINDVVKYVFMDDLVAASHLHHKKRAIPPIRESTKYENADNKRLKALLVEIEEKMFVQGASQSLAVFRHFDRDADGYITKEDLSKGLDLVQLKHTDEDCSALLAFLDENQNGFVTFSEFSKKIQPNILTVNHEKFLEGEDKHFNISQPSTKYHLFQQSRLQMWKPPENPDHKLTLSTRYGAVPVHQNTFTNFEAKPESAMFIPDNERFHSKKFNPINISHDDKHKLRKSADARMIYIQKTRENHEDRIKQIDEKERLLDSQRIVKRARVKSEYEAKCKAGLMD